MNTKIIIYDDSCPLCSAYTNAFIKAGFIDKEGRKNFSNITPDLIEKIDINRAVNEIPVIDTTTSQVWYGIDALLEILQQKIPFAKAIGNKRPIKWLLKKSYKFISYNRRAIVASKNKPGSFDCAPDFNLRYRSAFIGVIIIVNTLLLFPLHRYVLPYSLFNETDISGLQAANLATVLINILIALKLGKQAGIEYLRQINMIALLILVLTIPLITLNKYTGLPHLNFNNIYLGLLAVFAVKEYIRRMEFINFLKEHSRVILVSIISIAAATFYLIF